MLELLAEAGRPMGDAIRSIDPFAKLVVESPAFGHYLDTYLYFGVRFAAGRLNAEKLAAENTDTDQNFHPVALPKPPEVTGTQNWELVTPGDWTTIGDAEAFLDDFGNLIDGVPIDQDHAELWLRGLSPLRPGKSTEAFQKIVSGIWEWAQLRSEFYLKIEGSGKTDTGSQPIATEGGEFRAEPETVGEWYPTKPLIARWAIKDLYWLARILRANVTPRGVVEYDHLSWLQLVCQMPGREQFFPAWNIEKALRTECVLRAAFGYACDLIQNAVEIAEYQAMKEAAPQDFPKRPETTEDWRSVFDEELRQINWQREIRVFRRGGSDVRKA